MLLFLYIRREQHERPLPRKAGEEKTTPSSSTTRTYFFTLEITNVGGGEEDVKQVLII